MEDKNALQVIKEIEEVFSYWNLVKYQGILGGKVLKKPTYVLITSDGDDQELKRELEALQVISSMI
jgi:hypothetical protein